MELLLKVIKDDSVFKGSSEQDALVSKMAGGYLILALLIILPLLASGQTLGTVVDTRTISNIREILQSKNRLIRHDTQMDREATFYPDCFYHKTVLAMNIEKGKTRPDNVGIMISGQESTYSMENIVETWVDNTDFIEKIRNSTVFGCAYNASCPNQKVVLSCAFDNPIFQTLRPPIPYSPRPAVPGQKPYALTPDMFQDILNQMKSAHPNIQYDNEYSLDLRSASYWKCPFPHAQSPHYEVGNGWVERSKQDNFGVILELGKGVPYHDGKMREAFKGFADRWKSFRFARGSQIKFGCSVDPDCYGDTILLCAFYPIDPSNWPPYRV